jgi:hypothetical protein
MNRASTTVRGYGHRHQRRRAQLAPLVNAGMYSFRAAKYGRGDSQEAAILSAKRRYVAEQGTDSPELASLLLTEHG